MCTQLTGFHVAEEEDDESSTPPSSPPVGAVRRGKFDDEEAEDSDVRGSTHIFPRCLPSAGRQVAGEPITDRCAPFVLQVLDSWDAAEDSEVEREKAKKAAEAKAKAEAGAAADKKSKTQRIAEHQADRARRIAENSEA